MNSNFSHIPPFGKTRKCCSMLLAASFLTAVAEAQQLRVGDIDGEPGDSVVLPVTIAGPSPITGLQFDFVFPGGQADPNRPSLESPDTDHRVEAQLTAPGRHRVVVFSPTNKALPAGALLSLPLNLTSASPQGGPDYTVQNIRFITTGGQTILPTPSYGALSEWRKLFFSPAELQDAGIVGDDKDMDRDGVSNLLEFVTGGNPKVSEPENRRPAASTRTEAGKQYFVLKYRQNAELENASLLVEAGADLRNWTAQPQGTPTGVTDSTSLELETKLEINGPAKFLRLKVRRVPAQP